LFEVGATEPASDKVPNWGAYKIEPPLWTRTLFGMWPPRPDGISLRAVGHKRGYPSLVIRFVGASYMR
jgi:hypothetical protein